MPIEAVNPVELPPVPARVFPRLWLESFAALADDGGFTHARVSARLRPYRDDNGDGVPEFAPGVPPLEWSDGNAFTLHLRRPDLDAVVGAVLDQFPAIRAAAPSHTLAVLELLAQVVGAVSQSPVTEEIPLTPPPAE